LLGLGAICVTSSLPIPIKQNAKTITVVCSCQFNGRDVIVFDDKPDTIYIFESGEEFDTLPKAGTKFLVNE
jgi:hypothetical protein